MKQFHGLRSSLNHEDGQSNFLFFTRWERAIKEHGETVDDADAAWSLGKDIVTLGQTNQ